MFERIHGAALEDSSEAYLSMAALNALNECFLEENGISDVVKLSIQKLKIEQFVCLNLTTIINLQVLPLESKRNSQESSLISKFQCSTFGG